MIKKIGGKWVLFCKWIERCEVLILVLLAGTVLRIPSLLEPNHYGDEDIYLAMGVGLRKGLLLYRDIFDHKPPLIYWMAALAGNIVWFKVMLLLLSLLGIVGFWMLSKRLWKSSWASFICTSIYMLLTTLPFLEGNIVNAELLMIVPVIWGVYGLLKIKKKWWEYFLIGNLFGVGLLLKVPVVMDFAGVMLWFFVYKKFNWRRLYEWIVDKKWWLMIIGFLTPTLLSVGYFWMIGVLPEYFNVVWGFNVSYVTAWEGGTKPMIWESGLFQRGVVLVVSLLGILSARKFLGEKLGLVLIWFMFALFGVSLSGRPYPHYWIQAVPAFSLVFGSYKKLRKVIFALILVSTLTGLTIWRYGLWHYETISYYQNFVNRVSGKVSAEGYKDYFGDFVGRNIQTGRYIKERTEENERIFVWGTEPAIYVLADRAPVGRYTVAFHIKDLRAFEEIEQELRKQKPKFIVVMDYEDDFPQLDLFLEEKYVLVEKFDNAMIYRWMEWR